MSKTKLRSKNVAAALFVPLLFRRAVSEIPLRYSRRPRNNQHLGLTRAILGLALGTVIIILGLNEATVDILDPIGSNYWLAYAAIISGAAIITLVLVLYKSKLRK